MNRKIIGMGMIFGSCLYSTRCLGTEDRFIFMRGKHLKRNDQSILDFQEIEKNNSQFVREMGRSGRILNEWEKICPDAKVVPDKPFGKKLTLYQNICTAVENKDLKHLQMLLTQCSSPNTRDKFIKKYPFLLHIVIRFYISTLENTETIDTIVMIINHLIRFGYSMDIQDETRKTSSELRHQFYSKCRELGYQPYPYSNRLDGRSAQ